MAVAERAIGAPLDRLEGREKVAGQARYAYEQGHEGVAYGAIVQAPTARGRIRAVDASAALALSGVLAVLSHENAPALPAASGELAVLQSDLIAYRGQIVAAAVAESLEAAEEAARLVRVVVDAEPHDAVLRAGHPGFYAPGSVNGGYATDAEQGDPDAALAAAAAAVDAVYETAAYHANALEPHATLAVWDGDGGLTVYDSTQGASWAQAELAGAFGIPPASVRVIAPHVGGAFGSKGATHPHVVLAALAARAVDRPVKVAVTRRQMFALTGYRTPTIQRVRLGAGRDGRLAAIVHDSFSQTSTLREFAEQAAVGTRMMYAAPNRRTTHRIVALDVPSPSWVRAPGECPGMFALESALDELAEACSVDPVELRIRNEPETDPETGRPFSSRGLVACLREGAERFGWSGRDPAPGARRDGPWLAGTGVASSAFPAYRWPSRASARREPDGDVVVEIAAGDVGTGARTALAQIAADALGLPVERVRIGIGDSLQPRAPGAGGSAGTASWGTAVHEACRRLRESGEDEARVDTRELDLDEPFSRHAFGAQFAEVRVNAETGEVRVPRLLGVFAAGTIVNAKLARSQFRGGMIMGLGMALLEESVVDPGFGDFVNADLAACHLATYADVGEIEAVWIDERDAHVGPVGSKGIGEIGIVGTAAAVANALHHATGRRFRRLPVRPDRVLAALRLR